MLVPLTAALTDTTARDRRTPPAGERTLPGTAGVPADARLWGTLPKPPVSIVILTFNEALNIRECIESCAWCDDVHVLDSGSTDGTQEIARSLGATVHINKFKSFGDQRNWAIDHIPCKYPWHFHLDADERFMPELVREMHRRLKDDGAGEGFDAYLCPSKMILMGRWLKYSGGYPSYQVRLFRYGKCRFVDFGHGQREDCAGKIGTIVEPYMHYNFSKGLLEWFYKHNDYSSREANEAMLIRTQGKPSLSQLLTGDPTTKRRHWKNMSYFVRGRFIFRFLYNYVLRGGFLDGAAGVRYCSMISSYEYWTELKIRERAYPWNERTMQLANKLLREERSPGAKGGVP